jgi:hypothetical protein
MRPERAEHPVRRIARDGHDLDTRPPSEQARDPLGRRKRPAVELGDLRQVVRHQPHRTADLRVVREDHDGLAGDATQLLDPGFQLVVPVVDRDHRHRRIDAVVAQRQRARRSRGRRAGSWVGRCAAITSLGSTAIT